MIVFWGYSWGGGFWVVFDVVWRRGMFFMAIVLIIFIVVFRYFWYFRKVKVRGCYCYIGDRSYAGIGVIVWRGGKRIRGSRSMSFFVVFFGIVVRIFIVFWFCVFLIFRFCRFLWKKWLNMYFKIIMFLIVIFRKNYS